MDELKPCPFCGWDKISIEEGDGEQRGQWVACCGVCGAEGPGPNTTPTDARIVWNTRVEMV
jgi:Lar family restriction alleviation protein